MTIGKVYRLKVGSISIWSKQYSYEIQRSGAANVEWLNSGETFLLVETGYKNKHNHLHILSGRANGWISFSQGTPSSFYFEEVKAE